MENVYFTLGVLFFLSIYALLNYYIGIRGWQSIVSHSNIRKRVYWIVFWAIAFSYLLARAGEKILPIAISSRLVIFGAYWLGAMFYLIMILLLIDLVRLGLKIFGVRFQVPAFGTPPEFTVGVFVILIVVFILGYGTWNARHPVIVRYDVNIDKPAGNLKTLHAAVISDVHLGTIIHNGRLTQMVNTINSLKPDIVLLVGDTIDEDVEYFIQQKMPDSLRQIKSKYGTYAVMGNHEYIGGKGQQCIKTLEKAGIPVLVDKVVTVAGNVYLAGRDDKYTEGSRQRPRKHLAEVLKGVDFKKPIILMDHHPTDLGESAKDGVDLQFSGHTHRGQMFPNNFITHLIYENDWGYLRKGKFQSITSCGYGTWGPPIRLGNHPEVLDVYINFKTK